MVLADARRSEGTGTGRGVPADLIPYLEEALRQDPTLVGAWEFLGWAYWRTGQREKTARHFEALMRLMPDQPLAHNMMAQYGILTEDWERVDDGFRKSLELALLEREGAVRAGALGDAAHELVHERLEPRAHVVELELRAHQSHATVDVEADAARRDDAVGLIHGRHAADGEPVAPVDVRHRDARGDDAGERGHVRDLLERLDPGAFDALLLYEVSGRSRKQALDLSERAAEVLSGLRNDIAAAWKSIEALDEVSLQNTMASGSLRLLETLDGRSAYLLAWADFCRALASDLAPDERKATMQRILSQVAQGSGWIQSPDPVQRCGGLLMAAIAARLAEEYDQADQYSLQIVKTYGQIGDTRDRARVRTASLVAVIEQIRTLRDRDRHDDALSYVEQIRAWAAKSRPDDLQASLAIAWAHHTVLARRTGATSQPQGLLRPEDALQPLESFARPSPEPRDALYAVLAGAVRDDRPSAMRTPFGLQLLLGATVAELSFPASSRPAASQPACPPPTTMTA